VLRLFFLLAVEGGGGEDPGPPGQKLGDLIKPSGKHQNKVRKKEEGKLPFREGKRKLSRLQKKRTQDILANHPRRKIVCFQETHKGKGAFVSGLQGIFHVPEGAVKGRKSVYKSKRLWSTIFKNVKDQQWENGKEFSLSGLQKEDWNPKEGKTNHEGVPNNTKKEKKIEKSVTQAFQCKG